ncbi:MAG: AAA family ATPase [Thermotogae bacterium]|nr:AAA family ATPase [Thermotogota bacterium]
MGFKIKEVKLENFRKHRKRTLEFKDGINVIVGPNGAGKSSILDAIELSLYYSKGDRIKFNLRRKAGRSRVDLTLKDGDTEYEFFLEFGEKKSTEHKVIRRQGEKFKEMKNSEALKEMGFPTIREHFDALYYLHQGVFGENPKHMADVAEDVLGIKDLETLKNIVKEEVKRREGRIENLRTELKGRTQEDFKELGDLKYHIKRLENEMRKREKEWSKLKGLKRKTKEEKEHHEKKIEDVEFKLKRMNNLEKGKASLEGQVKHLKNTLQSLHEKLKTYEINVSEGLKFEDVQKKFDNLNKLRRDFENLKGKIEAYEKQITTKEKERNEIKQRMGDHIHKLKNYKDETFIEKLKDSVEALRVVERLEKDAKEYEEVERELKEIDGKLRELRYIWQKIGDLEKIVQKIEEKVGYIPTVEEVEEKRQELSYIRAELEHARERLKSLEKGHAECPICRRPFERPIKELIEATRKEIEELRQKERELSGWKDLMTLLSRIKEKWEEIGKRVKEFNELEDYIKEDVPRSSVLVKIKEKVKELGEDLKHRYDDRESKYENLKKVWAEYTRAKNVLDRIPEGIREEVRTSKDIPNEVFENYLKLLKTENEIKRLKEIRDNEIRTVQKRYPSTSIPKTLDELTKLIVELEDRINILEKEKEYLKIKNELDRKERELEDLKGKIWKIEEEIKRLGDRKILDLEKRRLENRRECLEELVRLYEEKMREIRKIVDGLEKDIEYLRGKYEDWKDLVGKINKLLNFLDYLDEKLPNIRERMRKSLEELVKRYFLDVFNYRENYQDDFSLDDDYLPKVGNRKWSYGSGSRTEDLLPSGGEKTAYYLSFIMALREILAKRKQKVAPVLILDEPTVHLDGKRRREMWNLIRQLYEESGLQIIVVTHDDEAKNSLAGIAHFQEI